MRLSNILDRFRTDSDSDLQSLEQDDVFRILGSERRRLAVQTLASCSGELPLDILAREVAAGEEGVAPGDVSREAYQRVRIALYQSHIIVMDDLGVLEWEEETGVVTALEPVAGLAEIVEEVDRRCR